MATGRTAGGSAARPGPVWTRRKQGSVHLFLTVASLPMDAHNCCGDVQPEFDHCFAHAVDLGSLRDSQAPTDNDQRGFIRNQERTSEPVRLELNFLIPVSTPPSI